jgi:hypothetical protein
MEPTPQQDLTIGLAHGGLLKNLIEQHNLVARQVLTPEEAGKLLNHSVHEPKPDSLVQLLERVIAATRSPATTAPAASPSVVDLTTMPLEEQRRINADYLPESRYKLESVILNPYYDAVTGMIRPLLTER